MNQEYCDLLLENQEYHKKVSSGKATYNSREYAALQKKLLAIELTISSKEIIEHAAYLFPEVSPM